MPYEGVITGSSPSSTPPSPPKQSSPSSATLSSLEQRFDNPVSPAGLEDSLYPLPVPHHEALEAQQDQSLFQLGTDTVNQMKSLLESALGHQNCMETEAIASSSQNEQWFELPMIRGKEKKLKWNSTIHSGPVFFTGQ